MWLDHLLSREFFGRVEKVQRKQYDSIQYKTDISKVEADEDIQV